MIFKNVICTENKLSQSDFLICCNLNQIFRFQPTQNLSKIMDQRPVVGAVGRKGCDQPAAWKELLAAYHQRYKGEKTREGKRMVVSSMHTCGLTTQPYHDHSSKPDRIR